MMGRSVSIDLAVDTYSYSCHRLLVLVGTSGVVSVMSVCSSLFQGSIGTRYG